MLKYKVHPENNLSDVETRRNNREACFVSSLIIGLIIGIIIIVSITQ